MVPTAKSTAPHVEECGKLNIVRRTSRREEIDQALDRLWGSADQELATDDIMEMTRGE